VRSKEQEERNGVPEKRRNGTSPFIANAGDSFASLGTSLSNPKKACHSDCVTIQKCEKN